MGSLELKISFRNFTTPCRLSLRSGRLTAIKRKILARFAQIPRLIDNLKSGEELLKILTLYLIKITFLSRPIGRALNQVFLQILLLSTRQNHPKFYLSVSYRKLDILLTSKLFSSLFPFLDNI